MCVTSMAATSVAAKRQRPSPTEPTAPTEPSKRLCHVKRYIMCGAECVFSRRALVTCERERHDTKVRERARNMSAVQLVRPLGAIATSNSIVVRVPDLRRDRIGLALARPIYGYCKVVSTCNTDTRSTARLCCVVSVLYALCSSKIHRLIYTY